MIKLQQRLLVALTLSFCLISSIVVTALDAFSVSWDQSVPVTWDLFQGTPPPDASQRTEAAAIHMTLRWNAGYSISSSNGGAMWTGQVSAITVTNTMEPNQSWVVPGKATSSVLSHEQLHFDLNEVYRRKLECLLLAINPCQAPTQQSAIDQLVASLRQTANAILLKAEEIQELYDEQTNGSQNAAEQARWKALVSNWLLAPLTAP